ncbi:MAG: hypothetical protein KAT39_12210, partial [Alphaproteobacteria bacterium]|nr:hypothetical protein [Alphaproteobacteria bacterium]
QKLAATIAPLLALLMLPGGVVLSDQPLPLAGWAELPPPPIQPGRYYIYSA